MAEHQTERQDETLVTYSSALQELAHVFYDTAKEASLRIMSNLRVDALRNEASLTERFWAYLEMGLDRRTVIEPIPIKVSAVAFTDRGEESEEVEIGADMACFIRYDLPGLRWAKGFIGHSKIATVTGWRGKIPVIGLSSEAEYDRMIQQCSVMGNITDESYVFLFTPESVTVEKAENLLGDLGESYPEKPWQDLHKFRDEAPVDMPYFYGALAGCQLGDTLLDKPTQYYGSVLELVAMRKIQTVLLIMVGTMIPQKPLDRDAPELEELSTPIPETYWLWPDLMQMLINR